MLKDRKTNNCDMSNDLFLAMMNSVVFILQGPANHPAGSVPGPFETHSCGVLWRAAGGLQTCPCYIFEIVAKSAMSNGAADCAFVYSSDL